MALYHFHSQIISRANGQSACAAAAYRSGEKIKNEFDGITHDYTQKYNVIESVVMLPEHAPAHFAERSKLWNAVEQNEKQMNAQLAREIEFALPRELPLEVQKKIALEFIQEQFVDEGMIADVAFHNPPKMDSKKRPIDCFGNPTDDPEQFIYVNPHLHALLTLRPLDEDGNWETKKQKLYVCEKAGEQKLFTANELKLAEGWEKLFHYESESGAKSWHTKSYATQHPEECAKLLNRYPKCEQVTNEKIENWNSPETFVRWRAAWAEKVNAAYELAGLDLRVDHRTYKEQGLDLIPTVHEGKYITVEEKRLKEEYEERIARGEKAELIHTDVRNLNIAIREHNKEIRMLAEMKMLRIKMEELLHPVMERMEQIGISIAERLENLRIKIILTSIKLKEAVGLKGTADEKILSNQKYIKDLAPVQEERLEELRGQIAGLKKQLSTAIRHSKKETLQQRLEYLQAQVKILEENREYAFVAQNEINELRETSDKIGVRIQGLQQTLDDSVQQYHAERQMASNEDFENINNERCIIRQRLEEDAVKYISTSIFKKEARELDEKIFGGQENVCTLRDDDVQMHF